jgi:hypothetical protein
MYLKLKPSIYSDFGVTRDPRLSKNVSFQRGAIITGQVPSPLVFAVNNTKENPPSHFEGVSIPVMSKLLMETLGSLGVDSVVPYPALLRNDDAGLEWAEYFAVNILGLASCADMGKSDFTELGRRVSGELLVRFHKLVVDPLKVHGLNLFRLAESPSTILVHERVAVELERRAPVGGWGIALIEVG